jgi:hypothetical protein
VATEPADLFVIHHQLPEPHALVTYTSEDLAAKQAAEMLEADKTMEDTIVYRLVPVIRVVRPRVMVERMGAPVHRPATTTLGTENLEVCEGAEVVRPARPRPPQPPANVEARENAAPPRRPERRPARPTWPANAPDFAIAHAHNEDGSGYFYNRIPKISGDVWDTGETGLADPSDLEPFEGVDWKDSLILKPR